MKYTLNEGYNGNVLTTQCGHIFKKDQSTEVREEHSPEVQKYIEQKFIIPITEKAKAIKDEINEKREELAEEMEIKLDTPVGVSTVNLNEESFKSKEHTNTPEVSENEAPE